MSLDLFTYYFPAVAELDTATLQSMRARLLAWVQPAAPTLDMRAGSVFAGAALDPLAVMLAGIEKALDRVRSDHDTSVVASGTVYDCDYVETYLKALGGVRQESVVNTGYLLLQFSADADVTIPAGIQFLFNNSDIFLLRVEDQQALEVLRSGSVRTQDNQYVLAPYDATTFACLVPVQGTPATAVTSGDAAQISQTVANLTAATASADFAAGRAANTVPEIARRATQAFAASGFLTRDGTREQLLGVFPDLTSVASTLSGDVEQLRGAVNTLGLASGAVDVLIRSSVKTTFTQTLRVNFYDDQAAVAVDRFIGVWSPVATPIRLVSIKWTEDTTIDLQPTATSLQILSGSLDPVRAPLLTCAYSDLEELTLSITMPRSATNQPLITTEIDETGQAYALFDITFVGDPAIGAVTRYLESETPVGVDILVRAPTPIVFEHFEIGYSRTAGTVFNLAQAKSETEAYFKAISSPARFSSAKIFDIAYYAGADDVTDSNVRARLKLSLATHVLSTGSADPTVNYALAMSTALQVDDIILSDLRSLSPTYRDPRMGTADSRMGVASTRTISYEMPDDLVSFQPHLNLT